jgi:peptidoglycan-associated lipoprotein
MRIPKNLLLLQILSAAFILIGCSRSPYEVWEDTKTCGRHVNRGFRSLNGRHGDSRAVNSPDDFYCDSYGNTVGEDFIPLMDDERQGQPGYSERGVPPPRETPGDPGSTVPGIESFRDPATNSGLARVFRNIYFEYNSNLVKGQENLEIVRSVTNYMLSQPNTYIFVEGHADERGPEAYNLALGSRRANSVRELLIQNGVHPDHIFTISYGKERPLVLEHHEEAWSQNRRAEFKVYQR